MISRIINWLLMWEIKRSIQKDERRKRREKSAAVILLACALSAFAGCSVARGPVQIPYQGPLVRDNGDQVVAPDWEAAP
jgi:hypothetical protein